MEHLSKKDLQNIKFDHLPNVLQKSLWVMEYLSTDVKDRFGASEVANYIVNTMGVSTSKQAVHYALKKAVADKLCHKNEQGFKLMKKGQDVILQNLSIEKVLFLEPGKPYSAGVELGNIFAQMSGIVRINDTYIDEKTLDTLFKHFENSNNPIRLLTSKINNESRLKRELKKLQIEGLDIQVRKYSQKVLHDRYLLDNKSVWLSGNSLNNLGKKESFIVKMSDDMYKTILKTFDERWKIAAQLS